MTTWRRWVVFNLVGAMGIGVQLGVLGLLTHGLAWHYLPATAVAVAAAVLHNFVWHRRWTWRDRRRPGWLRPLIAFAAANGTVSFAGNLILMTVLVGAAGLTPLPANGVAIAGCGLANFVLSDRVVFSRRFRTPSSPCPPDPVDPATGDPTCVART